MSTAIPSIDPADEDSLIGAFRHILGKFLQGVDDMLPAQVISYDRTTNRAVVQPLVMLLTTDNKTVQRPAVASVPVIQYGGGGFVVSAPIKAGNLGWIKANDRDISLFLQSFNNSSPNTVRKHSFSDAVFIPDVMTGYTIDGEDTNNLVIQSLDGSTKISVGDALMKFKVGDTIMEISPSGISTTSASFTHNGVNIGDTHIHPQGADSAGNAQQNTGTPQ